MSFLDRLLDRSTGTLETVRPRVGVVPRFEPALDVIDHIDGIDHIDHIDDMGDRPSPESSETSEREEQPSPSPIHGRSHVTSDRIGDGSPLPRVENAPRIAQVREHSSPAVATPETDRDRSGRALRGPTPAAVRGAMPASHPDELVPTADPIDLHPARSADDVDQSPRPAGRPSLVGERVRVARRADALAPATIDPPTELVRHDALDAPDRRPRSAPAKTSNESAPPDVHITIGRVEVASATPPRRERRTVEPALTLTDYLARRSGP